MIKAKLYNRWVLMDKELTIVEFFDITLTVVRDLNFQWSLEVTLFNFGVIFWNKGYDYE